MSEQILYTKRELFEILTSDPNWYDGLFTYNNAAVIKSRHKTEKLGEETYDEIFFHFGYFKQVTWSKIKEV